MPENQIYGIIASIPSTKKKPLPFSMWVIACTLCPLAAFAAPGPANGPLRIHPQNPRYFEFRGKPAVLITSGEHYGAVINLDFNYIAYLDELVRYGFNLTRVFSGTYRELAGSFNITGNTLAPAAGRFVCPWVRSAISGAADGGNKFDLTRWDEKYFARLKDFIKQADERNIVVELVFFCTMYDDRLWEASPMNAHNNVNGVGGVGPYEVYNAENRRLLEVQQTVVRKLVTELNEFDNLYYEVCNEPYERGGLTKVWNDRIIDTIVETEAGLRKKHLIAQGFPPLSAAVTDIHSHVSILNFHAAKPATVQLNYHLNKVLAFDETGGSDQGDRKYRTEGWDWIMAGGGVYDHLDFSFATDRPEGAAVPLPPGTPGGGGPELRRQLRILKEFIESFDFLRMTPHDEIIKTRRITALASSSASMPEPTVRVLAELGKTYAIYINGGVQAELELELPANSYQAEWVNAKSGRIDKTETFRHAGGRRTLTSPAYSEDIALRLTSRVTNDRSTGVVGPLRVHPTNARYFTDGIRNPDGSLKAVYLTGSHTWANLIDRGPSDPPPVFDFDGYLNLLQKHHHNFIRLWGRQVSWYHDYGEEELHAGPLAWLRTGPGNALDGKPKFDLTRLNQAYFDCLRARVVAAHDRGIYVGVMLFGGSYECRGGWQGNPFNIQNNINGVNGDPSGDGEGLESHTLELPAITRLQESYVRKVIDTVNDLDNVLYEISNEGEKSSKEWQYHLIRFIHDYEAARPKQHPVGMTAIGPGDAESNAVLSASPAEWISPHTAAWDGVGNTPVADGTKVSLLDSDHWFVVELYNNPTLGRQWVWKSLCRGHNPILMEHLPPQSMVLSNCPLTPDDPGYIASREAMGHTRRLAERMNLAAMAPHGELASTGYCLVNPGAEYLIYQPKSGEAFSVELEQGSYHYEWFNPAKGQIAGSDHIQAAGGVQQLKAPFEGDAVLYLEAQ